MLCLSHSSLPADRLLLLLFPAAPLLATPQHCHHVTCNMLAMTDRWLVQLDIAGIPALQLSMGRCMHGRSVLPPPRAAPAYLPRATISLILAIKGASSSGVGSSPDSVVRPVVPSPNMAWGHGGGGAAAGGHEMRRGGRGSSIGAANNLPHCRLQTKQ